MQAPAPQRVICGIFERNIMTKNKTKMPAKPKELWMLWNPDIKDWAIALDDPRGCNAYLCAKNKKAAVSLECYQREVYVIETFPVRVI